MKIYVHVEEGEGERNGNSDYTRKWDSLSIALEEAILPFQETATTPRATVCITLSPAALRSIYILGFYITHFPPRLW